MKLTKFDNFLASIPSKLSLKKNEIYLITLILLIAVFFRFYRLEELYSFGWDQERDAQVVWKILKEGRPTLIGPRVVGDEGFFLGPMWYYLLAPFYLVFSMDPIAAAYFTAFAGILTVLVIYFVTRSLFGHKEAFFAGFIIALFTDRVAWNPALIPLFTLLILFICTKITEGNKKFIAPAFLISGLGLHIHFQAVIFFALLILALLFYYQKEKSIPTVNLFNGIMFLFLTFSPLIIFDLRHDFINSKSLIKFFSNTSGEFQFSILNIYTAFSKLIRLTSGFFPEVSFFSFNGGLLLILISTIAILISNISKQFKALLLTLVFGPLIVFSFYQGILSEYYFVISLIPIIFGISILLKSIYESSHLGKTLVMFLLIMLIFNRIKTLKTMNDPTNLYFKKQAVLYIVDQKIDPVFNVSYSTPPVADSGFRYLFKLYGRQPQDVPEGHLWTIVIPADAEDVEPVATFGDIGVIRR